MKGDKMKMLEMLALSFLPPFITPENDSVI